MLTKRDNFALGCAGVGIAGTPALSAIKTTNALAVQIDGQTYQSAATDNRAFTIIPATISPPAAFVSLAASKSSCFFVWLNPAGTAYVEQVTKVGVAFVPASVTGSGYAAGIFEWPMDRPGYALIGAIKVVTNASGAFVPATTSLAAANQTVTYYNVGPDLGLGVPY